jgi:hypothetical protein
MERAIMEAVARADLVLCQIGSLPWGKIALSVVLAAIIIKAVKYL